MYSICAIVTASRLVRDWLEIPLRVAGRAARFLRRLLKRQSGNGRGSLTISSPRIHGRESGLTALSGRESRSAASAVGLQVL